MLKDWQIETLKREQQLRISAARLQALSEAKGLTGADAGFEGLRDVAYAEACTLPIPSVPDEVAALLESGAVSFREAAALAEGGYGSHWLPGEREAVDLTRETIEFRAQMRLTPFPAM